MAFFTSRKLETTNNTLNSSPLGRFIQIQNKESGHAYKLSKGLIINTLNDSPQNLLENSLYSTRNHRSVSKTKPRVLKITDKHDSTSAKMQTVANTSYISDTG